MSIFEDRGPESWLVAIRFREKTVPAFHKTPAVISSAHHQIHLFPLILPDIGDPQGTGFTIK
jgi:hypothetical protein